MTRNVYILPSEDENCPGHSCYNISTFGTMADSFSNSSGLVAHFLEGTHLLDELVVFTNLANAVFEGEGRMEQGFHETVQQSTVVIKCTQHSGGIAFVGGFNITFKYLTITDCGVGMGNLVHKHKDLKTSLISSNATLGFFYAGDVTVDHISVQNWFSGNGLFVVVVNFDLIITTSSFTRYITKFENVLGGNVLVIYTDPLDCVHQSDTYNALIANTNVSSFGSNEFHDMASANGGILVGFTQRTYRVQLTLDSVVAYGIRGLSNIAVFTTMAKLPNYNLTVNNTNSSNGYGYGLFFATGSVFNFLGSSKCSINLTYSDHDLIIFIDNSVFNYNKLKNTSFDCLIGIIFINIQYSPTIKIQSTEISNNVDYFSELCISLSAYQGSLFGNISNVTVKNNSCIYQLPKAQTPNFRKPFAIYAYFVTTLRLKNVTIADNNMTGLAVYRTNIRVSGGSASLIHNNTGVDGGGIALYDDSYLLLEDDSHLTFTNNIAQRGGAIFVDAGSSTLFIPCFFQFPGLTLSQSAKVSFSNNKAATAGSAVYYARGNDCILYNFGNNATNTICGQPCFNKTFNYSTQTGLSVLSSEPYDVCFCTNNTPNCSDVDDAVYINAYPGEKVDISLVSVGWNNGVVPGTVQMQQLGNSSAESVLFNTTAMSCATISFTALHSNYSLKILGTSLPFGSSKSTKVLYLSLSNCPLGFHTSKHTVSCDCDELKKNISLPGTLTCDASTKTITRQGDVWIGNISECVVVHNTCPFDYCDSSQVTFTLADPSPQCALNRTGILCGECKEGLSLVLGSNNCIECPGFSYISFILLYAAAGFGLVILLLILNLTVSVGTINGLLFYANIIQVNSSIFNLRKAVPVLPQFIAWLNLDLGIETCFYNGMTAYYKVWLQFAFPLYIWFIIATIIILCRYSKWLSNKIGGNVVQVLATLILLSFTKIFRTIVLALKVTTLSCVYNDSSVLVWSADGSVYYLKWPHILLFLFALVFLLLALPYAIVLLFELPIERYLTKIGCFRRNWLKVKPLVDAYNGPYKDSCRFWTGLLILVRMVFTAASVNTGSNTVLIFTTTVVLVLIGTIGAFGGIYQKKHLDVLECWSLINLGVIPCSAASNAMNENIVGRVSEGLMLITFTGIITYHVFLCFPITECLRKCFKEKKDNDENEPLVNEDNDCAIQQLPTHSEFYLDREPLLNEYN